MPASIAAQSLLTASSLALQAHFNVMLPTGQLRPISCDFVTIAKSGDRKSTSDEEAMREVAKFQEELEEGRKGGQATSDAQKAAWATAKSEAVRTNKSRGASALEEALLAVGPDGRPHIVTATPGIADMNGHIQIGFEPPVRSAQTSAEADLGQVMGVFRLASDGADDAGQNPTEVGGLTEYTLNFVEDLNLAT